MIEAFKENNILSDGFQERARINHTTYFEQFSKEMLDLIHKSYKTPVE